MRFIFEALGYAPCELCLKERIPYYVAIPIAGLAVLFAAAGPKIPLIAAFATLALIFAGSAMFGAYHSGVEWGFWPGPKECTGSLDRAASVGGFFEAIANRQGRALRCRGAAHFRAVARGLERLDFCGTDGARLLGLRIKS